MKIIGAGMSGLLAAHYFRSHKPIVLEKQSSLPNNHHALLRFRTCAVEDLTKIRFTKATVQKGIWNGTKLCNDSNLMLNNSYSLKSTGSLSNRSIINLDTVERYIAPPDFVSRLAHGINPEYGVDSEWNVLQQKDNTEQPMISTMPISKLAHILGYGFKEELKHYPITTLTFIISVPTTKLYQTVYYPTDGSFYRISITGNKVIAESRDHDVCLKDATQALKYTFGIDVRSMHGLDINVQPYGKLIPCNTNEAKELIGHFTTKYNIYSLGRWGTHRQILMDDVVDDLKVIDRMIETNRYRR